MKPTLLPLCALLALSPALLAQVTVVPTDVQMPGTQPDEIGELELPSKCDNCHADYDLAVEPFYNWRGSMMAQATRDPLFWATVAVAEGDFPGAGDLCLRCHSTSGWVGGRSTPTDGSGLKPSDAVGVMCDACHQMTDPSGLEHAGVQVSPFVANDEGPTPEGYYGSGMYVFSPVGNLKLGPYGSTVAPHPFDKSSFHRSAEMCGTCHDVSNPVVGDLAPRNGAQLPLEPGTFSGVPGAPVDGKAAFNNFPFQYGVVERTFSEHQASAFADLHVLDATTLPLELQAGSIQRAYDAVLASNETGTYLDGDPRTFTCQACHMPPVLGKGCNKADAPDRADLPLHDMTGGNTWVPDAIVWLDDLGKLVIGGGLTQTERNALASGQQRALQNLQSAASLDVQGDTVRVVNLTGHKLISGFPEGRRMWLRVAWFDASGEPLGEDGAYGELAVTLGDDALVVESLLELHDPDTRVWEAHMGMSQDWAQALIDLGYPPGLALRYDRVTGAIAQTLGDVAALPAGSAVETLHFVLNDTVVADNRIPPYGMTYDVARVRNVLPVPETQFGDPGPGGTYDYWDEVPLSPPVGAATATIELLYQTTSWEYVQFLYLAGEGATGLLADRGEDLLDAWLATGMAAPQVMATATWTSGLVDCNENGVADAEDIALGTSDDCDGNGVPDECQPATAAVSVRLACTAPAPPGSLVSVTDAPHLGEPYTMAVDDPTGVAGLTPGATFTRVLLATAPFPGYPCGLPLPGLGPAGAAGELLVSVTPPNPVLGTSPVVWTGPGQPAHHTVALPCNPALHGLPIYGQAVMSDFSGATPVHVLTDGLDLVLGL